MILNNASNIKIGSSDVQKVYQGQNLVWERAIIDLDDYTLLYHSYQHLLDLNITDIREHTAVYDDEDYLYTKLVLKDKITVYRNVFTNISELRKIALPDCCTELYYLSFYGANHLEQIKMNGVAIIGDSAFRGCSNLETIEFPALLTTIGSSAFLNCTRLKNIQYNGTHNITIPSAFSYVPTGGTIYTTYNLTLPSDLRTWNVVNEYGKEIYIPNSIKRPSSNIYAGYFINCTFDFVFYTGSYTGDAEVSVFNENDEEILRERFSGYGDEQRRTINIPFNGKGYIKIYSDTEGGYSRVENLIGFNCIGIGDNYIETALPQLDNYYVIYDDNMFNTYDYHWVR